MREWNYLQWVEHAGIEHLRECLAAGDFLNGQANTLLALVLAGMGAALVYALPVFAPDATPLAWAALAVLVNLGVTAWHLMRRCIVTRPTWPLYNDPRHIYRPDLALTEDQARRYELDQIECRIDLTRKRNREVARWLDWCRYATLATPLWAVAVAVFISLRSA